MPRRSKSSNGSSSKRCPSTKPCKRCVADQAFLRSQDRPRVLADGAPITAVDLFAGCGGMTVGLEEAARRAGCKLAITLAVDSDAAALGIYKANFPTANTCVADVSAIFDGAVGAPLTVAERRLLKCVGGVDLLIGGPPCQGHSDLNNHTRRRDPKNALYSRMARAAEVLLPRIVVIENVATVQWDEDGVVDTTSQTLADSGYRLAGRVLDLRRIGVPQRRKRFVLIATTLPSVDPARVLVELAGSMPNHSDRTVRWAIADLMATRAQSTYDTASRTSEANAERIDLLFDNGLFDLPNKHRPECHRDGGHSYVSMYGRLRWARPAQTITTGFGSMGQGRYVHPQRRRTLTPHEAARLQTFPDWFRFGDKTQRGVLATVIGNAVPPLLMVELGRIVIPALSAAGEATLEQWKRA
jgi:DNA (cytosine-5)-methyltransferase 1